MKDIFKLKVSLLIGLFSSTSVLAQPSEEAIIEGLLDYNPGYCLFSCNSPDLDGIVATSPETVLINPVLWNPIEESCKYGKICTQLPLTVAKRLCNSNPGEHKFTCSTDHTIPTEIIAAFEELEARYVETGTTQVSPSWFSETPPAWWPPESVDLETHGRLEISKLKDNLRPEHLAPNWMKSWLKKYFNKEGKELAEKEAKKAVRDAAEPEVKAATKSAAARCCPPPTKIIKDKTDKAVDEVLEGITDAADERNAFTYVSEQRHNMPGNEYHNRPIKYSIYKHGNRWTQHVYWDIGDDWAKNAIVPHRIETLGRAEAIRDFITNKLYKVCKCKAVDDFPEEARKEAVEAFWKRAKEIADDFERTASADAPINVSFGGKNIGQVSGLKKDRISNMANIYEMLLKNFLTDLKCASGS